jgi:hypothetical protein
MPILDIEVPVLNTNRPFDVALVCPMGHRQWMNVDRAGSWARRVGGTIPGACPDCESHHTLLRVTTREAIFDGAEAKAL